MHATEKWRNVTRTLMVYLAATTFGSPTPAVVAHDDGAFNSQDATAFVRIRCESMGGVHNGYRSGRPTDRIAIRVVAECYARTPQDAASGSVDGAEALAEAVASRLSRANPELKDYVTDSTGATSTSTVLRFVSTPTIDAPPMLDGWARRIVTASGLWWPEHE